MRTAVVVCLSLAAVSVVATLISTGMEHAPACYDPPCGDAKSYLYIYGILGAIAFGVATALLAAACAVVILIRRR